MNVSRIQCPHCFAPLHVRDRMFVGKAVDCPDCGESFTIVSDGARHLSARMPVESDESATVAKPVANKPVVKRGNDSKRPQLGRKKRSAQSRDKTVKRSSKHKLAPIRSLDRLTKIRSVLSSPLAIAWIAATTVAVVIVVAVLHGENDRSGKEVTTGSGADNKSVNRRQDDRIQSVRNPVEEPAKSAGGQIRQSGRKNLPASVEAHPPRKNPVVKPPLREIKVSTIPRFIGNPVSAKKPKSRREKVRRVDVRAKLSQPILRFHQPALKPFPDLLDEVQEMSGIPIRYDQKQIALAFNQRVSLSLEKTTVKGILVKLLAKVSLTYKIEETGIRILPKD